MTIPFHKPHIGDADIQEVVDCLRSGWLTTGPRTKQFEREFASYVGAKHAVAVNSCTSALHLALEGIGLQRGESVLVPTMTFAATAEVVRYFDAKPLLVDCRRDDLNIDIDDAALRIEGALKNGDRVRAIIPVHYGGQPVDMCNIAKLSEKYDLNIVEDAAHCCPASYKDSSGGGWKKVGSDSDVCCYSFYANKCITTGEGGMACTNDDELAARMRMMSLHGISSDAWKRFTAAGSWRYEIIAPGFKYNLTDVAAALGLHQLRRADELRQMRERVALNYIDALKHIPEIVALHAREDIMHSWHLFVIKLKLDKLSIDRGEFIEEMKRAGIGVSVHWIPLHLHPYYTTTFGFAPEDYPVATEISKEIISLPIFPTMESAEQGYVVETIRRIVETYRR